MGNKSHPSNHQKIVGHILASRSGVIRKADSACECDNFLAFEFLDKSLKDFRSARSDHC
jgi:hypothetical protein